MPLRIKDLLDFDKSDLTSIKVLSYNSETDKFILKTPDKLLVDSTSEDPEPIPEDFVEQIEEQIDVTNMSIIGVDAGTF